MLKILLFLASLIFASYLTFLNKEYILKSVIPQKNTSKKVKVTKDVKVLVKKISLTSNDTIYKSIGTALAKESADIYPFVSEQITEVYFSAGELVQKSKLLVQLKDDEEKLAKELAQIRVDDTKVVYERHKKALAKNAVSESSFDTAFIAYKEAILELKQAQIALDKKQILAPFTGIVGIPQINAGDRVETSTLITGIDNTSLLYVDFDIPQTLLQPLKNAILQKEFISLATPSIANKTFQGYFLTKQNRIDPTTRSVKTRIVVDNEDGLLEPGISFELIWEIKGQNYPTVPEISLQWENTGSYIWLIENNKAKKIYVNVIARKSGEILVKGDIKENQKVVIEGVQRLNEGSNVFIVGES